MKRNDYEKVHIGSLVRFNVKHGFNYDRIGKVVYKRGKYVCVEPLEGEANFKSDRYFNGAELIAVNYSYLEVVE